MSAQEAMSRFLQAQLDEHVRPEVQALAKRGNITLAEYGQFRGNSWEHEHIVPALDDEAFAHYAAHNLMNCSRHPRPFSTYGEACSGLMAPELLRRWNESRAEIERLTERVESLREGIAVVIESPTLTRARIAQELLDLDDKAGAS